jgi:hypothetical protein
MPNSAFFPNPTAIRRSTIGALASALLCSGCVLFKSAPPSAVPRGMEVVVANDVKPPTPVIVYLGRVSGPERIRLGKVEPDSQRTLYFDAHVKRGDYLLVASDETGRQLVAQRVSLSDGERRLTWQPGERNVTTEFLR